MCVKGCGRRATRRGLCSSHYNTRRERDIAYGRWESQWWDAAPVREHVLALRAAGMGSRRICEISGVARSVLQALINGRRKYDWRPSVRISAANAEALLAVPLTVARGARVDATGTTRRLRALVAIGYTQAYLCRAIGVTPTNGSPLFIGSRTQVLRSTAEAVTSVYNALSMRPGPSASARNRAATLNWAPPLAWDEETIDLPGATAERGDTERVGFAERFLEMRELDYSDLVIADRWNMRPESLLRQLQRHGITPQIELANQASRNRNRAPLNESNRRYRARKKATA